MKDLAPHKWTAVIGKSPTKRDLVSWDEGKWITFLQFLRFFIEGEGEESKFKVTKDSWLRAEGFLDMPDHPFQEFLYRVNKFSYDPVATPKKFYWKLSSMTKYALGYLRTNPSLVSSTMRDIIQPEPRLNWCLEQTKIVETAVGHVIVPRADRDVGFGRDNQDLIPHQKRLYDASIKATDLLTKLINEVDARPEELKKMPLKDILMAIGRMSYVFSVGRNIKVNKGVFKQINIHAAGREELEAALLKVNESE